MYEITIKKTTGMLFLKVFGFLGLVAIHILLALVALSFLGNWLSSPIFEEFAPGKFFIFASLGMILFMLLYGIFISWRLIFLDGFDSTIVISEPSGIKIKSILKDFLAEERQS